MALTCTEQIFLAHFKNAQMLTGLFLSANFKDMSTPALTEDCPTTFQTDTYSDGMHLRKRFGHSCFLVATVSCL